MGPGNLDSVLALALSVSLIRLPPLDLASHLYKPALHTQNVLSLPERDDLGSCLGL